MNLPMNISNLFKTQAPKRLRAKDQVYFLTTLSEMLSQGFSLQQGLQFVTLVDEKHQALYQATLERLGQGSTLEACLRTLGFKEKIVAQIYFAEKQGRFIPGLAEAARQINERMTYQKAITKALIYPCFLLIFLMGLLFGMRAFMLPQIISLIDEQTLEKHPLARRLILFFTYLPQIFLISLALLFICYFLVDTYLLKKTEIVKYQTLCRIPMIRKTCQAYASYRLAYPLGHFYSNGFSMQQIVDFLISHPSDLFLTEVAQALKANFIEGLSLEESIKSMGIFTPAFPFIIIQGELTQQTGQKCSLYAQRLLNDLLVVTQRRISYIQPLLFILIAIFVMAMYLVMMLPMLTIEI